MPSEHDVQEALRRLKEELEHPAMQAAVAAPIGQEVKAAEAVLAANRACPQHRLPGWDTCPACRKNRERRA